MTAAAKQLAQRLLNLYYAGRPCKDDECPNLSCIAWDKVETQPESAFDELKEEIETP